MGKFKTNVKGIVFLLFFCINFIPMVAFADIGIYCPKCQKHLYDFKGEFLSGVVGSASDFVAVKGVPQPIQNSRVLCPFDGAPLNGWEYWFWNKGREEPKFAFKAITFLIKDENGNFVWFPDDVVMDEDVNDK